MKKFRFLIGFILLAIVMITGCITISAAPISHNDYQLIHKDVYPSGACRLYIGLNNEVSIDMVRIYSEYLSMGDGAKCSPLSILYYLPGQTPGKDTAWAYGFFNPNLEYGINGLPQNTTTP